jgi:hypothetical protein
MYDFMRLIADWLIKWSYAPLPFAIGLGLLLDHYFGQSIFQRTGALIVVYALCHFLLVERIRKGLDHFSKLLTPDILQRISGLTHPLPSKTNQMSDEDAETFIKAVSWYDDELKERRPELDASDRRVAANIQVQGFVQWKEYTIPQEQSIMERVLSREIYVGIIGTLIWGFGDWVANLILHCGKLSC